MLPGKALAKLPKIESQKEIKNGTAHVPEMPTGIPTENSVKIYQNSAKSRKVKVEQMLE